MTQAKFINLDGTGTRLEIRPAPLFQKEINDFEKTLAVAAFSRAFDFASSHPNSDNELPEKIFSEAVQKSKEIVEAYKKKFPDEFKPNS